MSMLRFLCTADLHLGRCSATPFSTSEIDLSSAGAWRRIVDIAMIEDADAVLIAGDIFDGPGSYLEARASFLGGLKLLQRRGIPVVSVSGNHDYNVLPFVASQSPDNFHFLGRGGQWETKRFVTENGEWACVGWSFPQERVFTSQLQYFPEASPACPFVGLVHADIAPDSPYHPINPSELHGKADAWLLGHVHKPAMVSKNCCYAGSPQAFDFGPGERGVHGVRWLSIEAGLGSFSELLPISNVRFEAISLELKLEADRTAQEQVIERLQRECLALSQEFRSTESVHLRANVKVLGAEDGLMPAELAFSTFLDRHSIEVVEVRMVKAVDPWELKDLRDVTGEAARLLIGAKALDAETITGPEIPMSWIEDARVLVERGVKDIEFQFNRTLATVSEPGEGALELPDEEEIFAKAHCLLISELEAILQGAAS